MVALPTEKQAQRFTVNVIIAFVPAVILGLLFGKVIKAHLFTPVVVATTFIVGGFIILWAERRQAVAAFRRGEIKVLSNVDLFGEGFDVPSADASILLRPGDAAGKVTVDWESIRAKEQQELDEEKRRNGRK